MTSGTQILLALVARLLASLAPIGPTAYTNRLLPREQRRGVSVFPAWPLLPLIFLSPLLFLGAGHIVSRILFGFHTLLLVAVLA